MKIILEDLDEGIKGAKMYLWRLFRLIEIFLSEDLKKETQVEKAELTRHRISKITASNNWNIDESLLTYKNIKLRRYLDRDGKFPCLHQYETRTLLAKKKVDRVFLFMRKFVHDLAYFKKRYPNKDNTFKYNET